MTKGRGLHTTTNSARTGGQYQLKGARLFLYCAALFACRPIEATGCIQFGHKSLLGVMRLNEECGLFERKDWKHKFEPSSIVQVLGFNLEILQFSIAVVPSHRFVVT